MTQLDDALAALAQQPDPVADVRLGHTWIRDVAATLRAAGLDSAEVRDLLAQKLTAPDGGMAGDVLTRAADGTVWAPATGGGSDATTPAQLRRDSVYEPWADAAGRTFTPTEIAALRPRPIHWVCAAGAEPQWGTDDDDANRSFGDLVHVYPAVAVRPWFEPADWLWTPIPDDPILDPATATMTQQLVSGGGNLNLSLYDFGSPVYFIRPGDEPPVYVVEPDYRTGGPALSHTGDPTEDYGPDPLAAWPIPIPDEAAHAAPRYEDDEFTDAHLCIVDLRPGVRRVYSLWKARKVDGQWRCYWGSTESLDGEGNGGQATGAGLSRLAGLVMAGDVTRDGDDLGHTLFFSSSQTRANSSSDFRYPASKTDGDPAQPDGIPEGARVQLDPAWDVDGSAYSEGQKRILRTLQRFGAICADKGGSTMGLIFQGNDPNEPGSPPDSPSDPRPTIYQGLQSPTGFDAILAPPWSAFRVLAQWDGT